MSLAEYSGEEDAAPSSPAVGFAVEMRRMAAMQVVAGCGECVRVCGFGI